MNDTDETLRYPIGRAPVPDAPLTAARRAECIAAIESLPRRLRAAVHGLTAAQWRTPYRPGGWTVQQVVHHIPDSHLNAYVRFKLALTEDVPTIRPYDEAAWAELPDGRDAAPEVSLSLLEALHERWVVLLRALPEAAYTRRLVHPEHRREFSLDEMLVNYAWHGDHHLAHVTSLRARQGWPAAESATPVQS